MTVHPASPDQVRVHFLALVRQINAELLDLDLGARLDPRVHHGWWVLLDTAARREETVEFVTGQASEVITLVGECMDCWHDPHHRMVAFYVTWQVFRRLGLVAEQNALLAALEVPGDPHPLAAFGGMVLIRAFRALLTASLAATSESQLRSAFEDASKIGQIHPQVLAFNRLRRSVGTALLEALGEHHTDYAQTVLRAIREDFLREHDAEPRWLTPQLRAEALAAEARLLCLPAVADYEQASRLIGEARRVDRRSPDESNAQLQARLVGYEQQMLLVRSLRRVREVEQVLTQQLEERGRATAEALVTTQEEYRQESLQLLGLLAAVIALITSVAGGATSGGGLGVVLMHTLTTGGIIVLAFAAFPLIVSGKDWQRWLAVSLGGVLLLLGMSLFLWAPDQARFGEPPKPAATPSPAASR